MSNTSHCFPIRPWRLGLWETILPGVTYFLAGLHTTCPLSFSNVLSPIPLTFLRSSTVLNGRADTISLAVLAPIPGRVINSFSVALLISTGLSGFLADE